MNINPGVNGIGPLEAAQGGTVKVGGFAPCWRVQGVVDTLVVVENSRQLRETRLKIKGRIDITVEWIPKGTGLWGIGSPPQKGTTALSRSRGWIMVLEIVLRIQKVGGKNPSTNIKFSKGIMTY